MKFKKWVLTFIFTLTLLTANVMTPDLLSSFNGDKGYTIVYAAPKAGSSGIKSGSFSGGGKSSGIKSGSFSKGSSSKSSESLFGGSSNSNKGSSYNNSSSNRSILPIPIPIPFGRSHYSSGGGIISNIISAVIFGKLIKIIIIVLVIYFIFKIISRRK